MKEVAETPEATQPGHAGARTCTELWRCHTQPKTVHSSLAEPLCSSIKEVCLRVGQNVQWRCESNYAVFQVSATTRCAQRPSSKRSPAWQQFTCSPSYQAQKSWQEEHRTTHPSTAPSCHAGTNSSVTCHAGTLPGLHSNPSFTKTLEVTVSSVLKPKPALSGGDYSVVRQFQTQGCPL